MTDALRKALDYDPLDHAEKITGKHHSEGDSTAWMGMALMQAQRPERERLLEENDDTLFSENLSTYIPKIERMGFSLVLCEDIGKTKYSDGDKLRLYWRDDGLLLAFDSYNGDKSVNGGSVYFNYRGPRDALHRCSNGWIEGTEPSVWSGNRDCREGLRYALDLMRQHGEFVKPWLERPFSWISHYGEHQDGIPKDWEAGKARWIAASEARISKLPEDVRSAITPKATK